MTQQGDVLLYQTNDGGEINVSGGVVELSGGLETTVYLSLFGGNEDDPGGSDTTLTWWGNIDENQPERRLRSRTQNILRSLPLSVSNLRRIEDAVNRDLAWVLSTGVATEINTSVSIPGLNTVKIEVTINAASGLTELQFVQNWKAEL